MDDRDNVLPFKLRAIGNDGLEGKFALVDDEDLPQMAQLVRDRNTSRLSVSLLPPPDDCVAWELQDADQVESLGLWLIRFAVKMRIDVEGKGPP